MLQPFHDDQHAPGRGDSLDALFPARQTIRSFTVIAADLGVVARVAGYLACQRVHFVTLRAVRIEALIECRICISGISELLASAIRSGLQALDGVQRVRLDHHVQFGRRVTETAAIDR